MFEHQCEHCPDWGAFGYGVSLRNGRLGKLVLLGGIGRKSLSLLAVRTALSPARAR
jgi:hypothetical protein